jgi:hypothetical protein
MANFNNEWFKAGQTLPKPAETGPDSLQTTV